MRLAELTKIATATVASALASAAAVALPPPAPGAAALPAPAAAAASAAAPAQTTPALTAAAVEAVNIGQPGSGVSARASGAKADTLRELEELQARTALAEARKRLNEVSGGSGGPSQANAGGSASTQGSPSVARPSRHGRARGASGLAVPGPGTAPAVEPPRAKLVSLVQVGQRSRADVVLDGRVTTVKEGGEIGDWVVTRISSEGVWVKHHDATPDGGAGVAATMPAAFEYVREDGGSRSERTYKLPSATSADLQPPPPAPAPTGTPAAAQPPVVPPLPAPLQPDSTSVSPAVPATAAPPMLQPLR